MPTVTSVARTGVFAFALGVGLAIAVDGGGAVAAASPADAGSSASTGKAAHSASSAPGPRRSNSAASDAGAVKLSSAGVSAIPVKIRSAAVSRPVVIGTSSRLPKAPAPAPAPATQTVVGLATLAGRDVEQGRMYGNPVLNSKYWVAQSSQNCVLMATAMIIGQLAGKTPTEPQMVFEASTTPSVDPYQPGRNMYQGLKSEEGVSRADAMKLMANHGITSSLTTYPGDPDAALAAVMAALDNPDQAVMASIDADYIWSRLEPGKRPTEDVANTSNHMVVLTGIDTSTNTAYLNDSGWDSVNPATGRPWGQYETVPLDVFVKAWSAANYRTIIATADGDPKPQSAWVGLSPRRDTLQYTITTTSLSALHNEDPDAAAHLVHYRNTI